MWNFIDWSAEQSRLSIADARFIFKTLTSAVAHCHERGVIVRDLTPLNIMMKKNFPSASSPIVSAPFEVKIIDFSLCVSDGSQDALCDHALFAWSMVPYCAPEALHVPVKQTNEGGSNKKINQVAINQVVDEENAEGYDKAIDMWSLGVLLFVMIAGRIPWEGFERNCTVDDHILLSNIQRAGKINQVVQ